MRDTFVQVGHQSIENDQIWLKSMSNRSMIRTRPCPTYVLSAIPWAKHNNIVSQSAIHAPNVLKVNNAAAKPNAAGTIIKVPSHPGLSFVVAILSVVGGMLL